MAETSKRAVRVLVACRVPVDLAARLDALAKDLSTPWHTVKRGELARVAIERGLAALEAERAAERTAERAAEPRSEPAADR
jgi:predicted DNA-binding protein